MEDKICFTCEYFPACADKWHTYRHNGCEDWKDDEKIKGRTAKCVYCSNTTPSLPSLPFFEYKQDKKYDEYYCGCKGWD